MGLEFLDKLKQSLKPNNTKAIKIYKELKELLKLELKLYGSVAKNTNIKGDYDLDIFYHTNGDKYKGFEELKKALDEAGLKYYVKYSEHPYIKLIYKNYNIDLVPISTHYSSSVDRTPLHYNYVISKIDDNLRDEIRVLKLFLKTMGLYGADNKVNGFSGYLAELLIIYYRSFYKLIENASKWKIPLIIDIEGNKAKDFQEPLIVIDPTDGTRNVAAALSIDNLSRFILYSRAFLANPTEEYFNISRIHRKGEFGVLFKHDYDIEDKAYGILRKIGRRWRDYLENSRIFIEYLHVFVKNNLGYIGGMPISNEVHYSELVKGPNINQLKSIQGSYLKDGYLYIHRKFDNNIEELTKKFLANTNLKNYQIIKIGFDIKEFKKEREVEYWREYMLKI